MTKTLTFLLSLLLAITSFGQSFEGKIIYQSKYKSRIKNVTDEQLTTMMGSTQEYFIKDGDYKSVLNGTVYQWQIYVSKENKLYNKFASSESLLWSDGATNTDQVLESEVNKGVAEILGYTCDELILKCKSGIQKYYFNSKFAVDPKLYVNHKFGNWYDFISQSKALPLKVVVDNPQFSWEAVATEVHAIQLDKSVFELPAGSTSVKSPY